MFLNNHDEIALLRDMKEHTLNLYETIQRNDFVGLGKAIRKTWAQNQAIDGGTNPAGVKAISDMVDDLCLGYKLPGAGGGGYLYMVAKDPDAAARIRQILNANPQNANARFVDMTLSEKGLQVSRS
jgi:galactokinase/mevalonate kinase-like predicted kinase